MTCTCGYQHQRTANGPVRFISRGFGENDYCVNGKRVTVADSGETRRANRDSLMAIRDFELSEYAEYCRWHAGQGLGPLQPFKFPVDLRAVTA